MLCLTVHTILQKSNITLPKWIKFLPLEQFSNNQNVLAKGGTQRYAGIFRIFLKDKIIKMQQNTCVCL